MDVSPYWQNADDIRRDLFEYSNLPFPGDSFTPAPPKSIAEYRARIAEVKNPGIFDQCKENIGVFISGRGRYVKDRIIKPGSPVDSIPEDDFILKKKIRQVSGLGYGNEIIERAFEDRELDTEVEIVNPNFQVHISETPNLKLHSNVSGCGSPVINEIPESPKKPENQIPN